MPISKKTHTQTTPDGEPLYIVETRLFNDIPEKGKKKGDLNDEFDGTRAKIRFRNGIGKTKSEEKAKFFSETLGYMIKLHEDVKSWIEAPDGVAPSTATFEPEDDNYYTEDEETEEDYE